MSEERFNKIEATLAHQERQIADLSEMITAQWKEIDVLKLRLKKAQERLSEMTPAQDNEREGLSVAEIAALDKPPHY
jgi:uncharacterized coiled-coil protein SlyX